MEYLFSYISNHSIDGIYEHHCFLDNSNDNVYIYHICRKNNIMYIIDKYTIQNGSVKYMGGYISNDSNFHDLKNMVDISSITLNYLSLGKYAFFEFCIDYLIYHKALML